MGRYTTTPTTATKKGKLYKETTFYPDVPASFNDIYVYTDEGDRFDILAQQYYGDPGLWWIISSANPQLTQQSMFPPIGIQIRIPQNIGALVNNFNILNSV